MTNTCISNRVYVFHVRNTYLGREVVGIAVRQQGVDNDWEQTTGRVTWKLVTRPNGRSQFQISVNYKGMTFQKGELRSTRVELKLGRRVHQQGEPAKPGLPGRSYVTQELNRNCMAPNESLNRDTAQPNPIIIPRGESHVS